jgi:predicted metalloprotease
MVPSGEPARLSFVERTIAAVDSRRAAVATVVLCGTVAGALEYITHLAVAHMRPPLKFHAGVDAVVIAILTMTLVSVVITAARARRRQVLAEMRTVAELNHHVRNALQVIRDSHFLPEDRQAQAVMDSVERIDQTLKRLFPPTTTQYNEKKSELLQNITAETTAEKK